jgi:hypothetical protein
MNQICTNDNPFSADIMVISAPLRGPDKGNGFTISKTGSKYTHWAIKNGEMLRQGIYFTTLDKDYEEQLKRVRPKVVILLGEEPYTVFFNSGKLNDFRGSVHQSPKWPGIVFLPTYDPNELQQSWRSRYGKGYETSVKVSNAAIFGADFAKAGRILREGYTPWKENFNLTPSFREVQEFILDGLEAGDIFAADIETTSLWWDRGEIYMLGLARNASDALCIPFFEKDYAPYWNLGEEREIKKLINRLFTEGKMMWQNALFDCPYHEAKGYIVSYENIVHDTLLLHHAIDPDLPHNLGFINSIYGLMPYWKDDFKNRNLPLSKMDQIEARRYNLRDCVVLHQVLPGLLSDLEEVGTQEVYEKRRLALLGPCAEMRKTGILVSDTSLKTFRKDSEKEMNKALRNLRKVAGLPSVFNPGSTQHLQYFLFGVPIPKFSELRDLWKYEETTLQQYRCAGDHGLKKNGEKKAGKSVWSTPDRPPKQRCSCGSTEWIPQAATKHGALKNKNTQVYEKLIALEELQKKAKPLYEISYRGKIKHDTGTLMTDANARDAFLAWIISRRTELGKLKRRFPRHDQEEAALNIYEKFIEHLNTYAYYKKRATTYSKLPVWTDGYLHGSISPYGTATGRLATRDPNLDFVGSLNWMNSGKPYWGNPEPSSLSVEGRCRDYMGQYELTA